MKIIRIMNASMSESFRRSINFFINVTSANDLWHVFAWCYVRCTKDRSLMIVDKLRAAYHYINIASGVIEHSSVNLVLIHDILPCWDWPDRMVSNFVIQ